jgi:hypothetical protein
VTRWWLGLPAAQALIPCGEDEHRLRWQEGELHALEHQDPQAERTLAALGGQRCTCIDVLDAWARRIDDPRVLVLASRGTGDQLAPGQDMAAPRPPPPPMHSRPSRPQRIGGAGTGFHGRMSRLSLATPASAGQPAQANRDEAELAALLSLGGGLPDRLIATVAAGYSERLGQPDDHLGRIRPQLHAALHGRALAAIRAWLGQRDVQIDLNMIEPHQAAKLVQQQRVVQVALPFRWLVDVWSKGFATISGRFCLDAATDDGRRWTLSTVGPGPGPVEAVTLELPARPS